MSKSLKTLAISLGCAAGLAFSTNAMADCEDMGNSEWSSLSTEMARQYDAGNYEAALTSGKRLNIICPRSPIVNYTMSEIYARMGNEQEAAIYAKRATDYILDYQVPQAVNEKIWMRRAEYELPYKKEAEALKLQLAEYDALKAENAALQEDSSKRMLDAESQAKEDRLRNISSAQELKTHWNAAMWSGVGVAVVGLGVAIGGGVLTTSADKISYSRASDPDKSGFSVGKGYVAGWTMVGAGTAAAVAGVILTSVAAYKVSNIKIDDDSDSSVSFNISPNAVQFGMTF